MDAVVTVLLIHLLEAPQFPCVDLGHHRPHDDAVEYEVGGGFAVGVVGVFVQPADEGVDC
jgi:hypothetical protein